MVWKDYLTMFKMAPSFVYRFIYRSRLLWIWNYIDICKIQINVLLHYSKFCTPIKRFFCFRKILTPYWWNQRGTMVFIAVFLYVRHSVPSWFFIRLFVIVTEIIWNFPWSLISRNYRPSRSFIKIDQQVSCRN